MLTIFVMAMKTYAHVTAGMQTQVATCQQSAYLEKIFA